MYARRAVLARGLNTSISRHLLNPSASAVASRRRCRTIDASFSDGLREAARRSLRKVRKNAGSLKRHVIVREAAGRRHRSLKLRRATVRSLCPRSSATRTLTKQAPRRTLTMAAPAAASPKIQVLRSHERGHSDIGWLNSYHTFSFADYHNSKKERNQWSHLRVINEDRVAPTQGFPTHPHRDFEIYSYIISGAIEHKDSMGNVEVLHRGDIQFTSAGTGIAHSEFNASEKDMLHFIQIWVRPNRTGLKPNYQTKHYSEDDKKNRLRLVVSPTGEDNTIKINNDCFMYASLLEQGKSVTHNFAAANRKGFLHVAHTGGAVQLSDGSKLQAGDGAYIDAGTESLTITGLSEKPAEFLLWDLENK